MEKEKLSSDLKGLVGENSLSDRTWNDYIDNTVMPYLPSEADKVQEYLAKHATTLKSINGQFSHDVAAKVNEAKKAFVPTPQPQAEPTKADTAKKDEKPEWFAKYEQEFEQFKAEKANEAKALKQKQLLSTVTSKVKELGADNEDLLEMVIGSTQFAENASEDDCIKQVKAKYDEKYSKLYGEGVRPALGSSAYTGNAKAAKEAYKKHLEETGRLKKTQN